ncbi:MAG: hypothetical protein ACI4WS_01065 [Oscillospiraceae bacterium]
MSGPKTSKYRLTPAQRRALIARRERERRVGEARAYIVHLNAKLKAVTLMPASGAEQAEALKQRTGNDGGYSEIRQKLEKTAAAALERLASLGRDEPPEKLEKAVEDARTALGEAEKLREQLDRIAQQNITALRQSISDSLDGIAGADFGSIMTPAQKKLREMKLELSGRLAAIPSAELSGELRQDIADAQEKLDGIDSEDFLHNFAAMTVAVLEKDCRSYAQLRREIGGKYDRLLAAYHALCEERGVQPQGVPFSRTAPERLEQLIAELEAEIDRSEEQSFISRCIDEVLEDMGYDLIGERSVVKKNGAAFRNELYSFGDGTAVNVTYSSGGNITMELGGLDDSDRLPDAAEADRLSEDMRSFCGRFSEFERRLLEKGVESEHISLLPPDAEYAQIINLSDYDIREGAEYARFTAGQGETTTKRTMSTDE